MDTPDSDGWTALHNASRYGFTEAVRYLLERGADVHKHTTGKDGDIPLTLASDDGHLEVVRALVKAMADVSKRDGRGMSPISYALDSYNYISKRRRKKIAALLRNAGAKEPGEEEEEP